MCAGVSGCVCLCERVCLVLIKYLFVENCISHGLNFGKKVQVFRSQWGKRSQREKKNKHIIIKEAIETEFHLIRLCVVAIWSCFFCSLVCQSSPSFPCYGVLLNRKMTAFGDWIFFCLWMVWVTPTQNFFTLLHCDSITTAQFGSQGIHAAACNFQQPREKLHKHSRRSVCVCARCYSKGLTD